jgi:CRP/FNR family transcriptional regulator, nitrogen oxide reductase regulator
MERLTNERKMSETGLARESNAIPKLLAGIGEKDACKILDAATPAKLLANQMIVSGGEPATRLFLLRTGTVKYYRLTPSGDEVLLGWLVPGDVFGLGTLFSNPVAYFGSAKAVAECDLWVWQHDRVRKLAESYPLLAENALRIVLEYLGALVTRHVGLVSRSAEQRLADTLLNLGRRTGKVHSGGVDVNITNEQLGDLAHTTPFTASRLLRRWKRTGAVSKKRGKVVIHMPELLLMD